ncbi:AsmA family protein [Paraliomyxa miuraensis]|uniref:hypothetical protein n=1 Tax=Paraliomyxa miuraensis TaxID=376150 RepID=UPI0022584971|nr:hypothetical protein [Paraliomyxa miuraensis]MCX4243484.1 hypothetical protein [Paraliomyxa miuraensis]
MADVADAPPPQPRSLPSSTDCSGAEFEACPEGFAGPSCNYPCDDDAPWCSFRYYCHGDGRIHGIGMSRAHLFEFEQDLSPDDLAAVFETWITEHEGDLGFPDGLTTSELQIEPADDFEVAQGRLTTQRLRQFLFVSPSLPHVPVVGDGALITLETDEDGVVALKGTVVDPRVEYVDSDAQADIDAAVLSIRNHTSDRLGIPVFDIEVESLQLVAVPGRNRIGWYGVPTNGMLSLGRVIVDADPSTDDLLELLMFDDGTAQALHDTTEIDVRSQDLSLGPWDAPIPELVHGALHDGAPLLGSLDEHSGDWQMATERVVVVDLRGNAWGDITEPSHFERFTNATGDFLDGAPSSRFTAQRHYHLALEAYAFMDRLALGQWDSALQFFDMSLTSDYPPGTYRPRVLVSYDHAPTGAVGQASQLMVHGVDDVNDFFPEIVQRPAVGLQNEPVFSIDIQAGNLVTHVFLHEMGHDWDFALAPGVARSYVDCPDPLDQTCDEGTTDEALPLLETIAHMFAIVQIVRLFPGTPHASCTAVTGEPGIMQHLKAGGTMNNALVHAPGCMGEQDQIGLFLRDDDPACPDDQVCDRPSGNETDPKHHLPCACDHTEGYNVFSILQAWWNTVHGLYCAPTFPYDCTPLTPVAWPPGCNQPGSSTPCVTPEEAAGLALVYAVRTNPLTYADFFDSMTRFVACNYGEVAYAELNQALCDHEIRDCAESAPTSCETCGNGIREGSEECDGNDLSTPQLGHVPTCTDFGYGVGDLRCAPSCTYDFSTCAPEGLDDTGPTTGATPDTTSADATLGDATSGGAVGGVDEGCNCTASRGHDGTWGGLTLLLLMASRRRRRTRGLENHGRRCAVVAVSLPLMATGSACNRPPVTEDTADGSSGTTVEPGSGSETISVPDGWPELWYGIYYDSDNTRLGDPKHQGFEGWPQNVMVIESGTVTFRGFDCAGEPETSATFEVDQQADTMHLLRPPSSESPPAPGAEIAIRAGASCGEVVVELRYPDLPPHDELSTVWKLGELCLTDGCDDTPYDDHWTVDLCPGTRTECE